MESEVSSEAESRYAGEDTRQTSSKELRGWYGYAWAVEVFAVCGIDVIDTIVLSEAITDTEYALGSFIPITLEELARERGVFLSDKSKPCKSILDDQAPSATHVIRSGNVTSGNGPSSEQCVVYIGGAEINTASFAMYTFSISVLFQALLIISISGAADHGAYRKVMLLGFALFGAVHTMLFIFVIPDIYLVGSYLAIIGNVAFGSSFVLLNSFLPLYVRYHPSVLEKTQQARADVSTGSEDPTSNPNIDSNHEDGPEDSTSGLLASDEAHPYQLAQPETSVELETSTKISSTGIGIGYSAAVILQIISVLLVKALGGTLWSLRVVLFLIGLWWALFTIPSAIWLRPRPGPPLNFAGDSSSSRWSYSFAYLTHSWKSLGRTLLHARRLKDVMFFLAGWFLLSDALATISSTAILFGKTELNMNAAELASVNVCVTVAGILGALFIWPYVSRYLLRRSEKGVLKSGKSGKRDQSLSTLHVVLFVFLLIPLYALLSYFPPLKRAQIFGLQQSWEMYPLGSFYGLVLAGVNAYCRSIFGELVPPGYEAAFFALYAVTDKGSSVLGPAIVGGIVDATGSVRLAFVFLAAVVAMGWAIMALVNVPRGGKEGRQLGKVLQEDRSEGRE
ncbi:MAG: Autophagy protein 22 [Alyxoria varia]|nr:MAG: Autophagy protein 22 [Alyxoria varia]